jgi:hypothetical protein
MGSLAEAQFALLERIAAPDPVPCLIGGYAEDALLAGCVTRPHEDIDWLSCVQASRARAPSALSEASAVFAGFAPGAVLPDRPEEQLLPLVESLA